MDASFFWMLVDENLDLYLCCARNYIPNVDGFIKQTRSDPAQSLDIILNS